MLPTWAVGKVEPSYSNSGECRQVDHSGEKSHRETRWAYIIPHFWLYTPEGLKRVHKGMLITGVFVYLFSQDGIFFHLEKSG